MKKVLWMGRALLGHRGVADGVMTAVVWGFVLAGLAAGLLFAVELVLGHAVPEWETALLTGLKVTGLAFLVYTLLHLAVRAPAVPEVSEHISLQESLSAIAEFTSVETPLAASMERARSKGPVQPWLEYRSGNGQQSGEAARGD